MTKAESTPSFAGGRRDVRCHLDHKDFTLLLRTAEFSCCAGSNGSFSLAVFIQFEKCFV